MWYEKETIYLPQKCIHKDTNKCKDFSNLKWIKIIQILKFTAVFFTGHYILHISAYGTGIEKNVSSVCYHTIPQWILTNPIFLQWRKLSSRDRSLVPMIKLNSFAWHLLRQFLNAYRLLVQTDQPLHSHCSSNELGFVTVELLRIFPLMRSVNNKSVQSNWYCLNWYNIWGKPLSQGYKGACPETFG